MRIASAGQVTITSDDGLFIKSTTNGAGASIRFSDQTSTYSQIGTIEYFHADGSVSSEPQTSNDGFIISGTEANTVVRVQGDVDIDQDLNVNGDLYIEDQIFSRGDTDTYLQFHAANQFRIVTGGTEMFEVNDTNIQLGAALNVNNQVLNNVEDIELNHRIFHDGDTDTYFEFHNANQMRFVTGGTEMFEINDTQNLFSQPVLINNRLDVGNGAGGDHEIRIYKADNNVSDHIQFYNGTTRMGEIGCQDTSWLRINQQTGKNIYTPRMIRADGGFQAPSTICTHVSDTNTYIQFHNNDQFRVVTGGVERFEVANSTTTVSGSLNVTGSISGGGSGFSAWSHYELSGTHSSYASFNLSSHTDQGVGNPRFNMSTALSASNGIAVNTAGIYTGSTEYPVQSGARVGATSWWEGFCGSDTTTRVDWAQGSSACQR